MPQLALLRLRLRFWSARFAFFFPVPRPDFVRVAGVAEGFRPPGCAEDSVLATTFAVLTTKVPATVPATRANLIIRGSDDACFLSDMMSP
jgi:hypothetical protein